jgi:protein SCO1/2
MNRAQSQSGRGQPHSKTLPRDDEAFGVRQSPAAFAIFLAILGTVVQLRCLAQPLSDETLVKIRFDQKLGTQVSLDLPFRDEHGQAVRLGNYFNAAGARRSSTAPPKPIILVLGYYECPMLCTLQLNGMIETLEDMRWSVGHQFSVINVSINPRETPALAAAKKTTYLKRYGRSGASEGWHFLTGESTAIDQLAREVGYHFAYDESAKQYAHPSGIVVLTPEGKIAHYLFGVTFSASDLYASLQDASSKKIGSPIRELILLCFHYNPITGKYGAQIMFAVRLLSAGTVLALVGMVITLVRRERAKAQSQSGASHNESHQSTNPLIHQSIS